MINKEAYELLVNGYADEILEKTAATVKMPEAASKVWQKAQAGMGKAKTLPGKAYGTSMKDAINGLQGAYVGSVGTRAKKLMLKRQKAATYGNAVKSVRRGDIAKVVAGSGLVAGGAYAANRVQNSKTASEIVYDIMMKEAAGKPEIIEKGIKYVQDAPGKVKEVAQTVYESTPKTLVDRASAAYTGSVADRAKKLMLKRQKAATYGKSEKAIRRGDKIKLGLAGLGAAGAGGYGVYRANNPVAEKAAELLVEAVMVKQAAYNEMDNASICFDAGQSALDYMGYELD